MSPPPHCCRSRGVQYTKPQHEQQQQRIRMGFMAACDIWECKYTTRDKKDEQPSQEEAGDGNLCQKFGYCSPMSKKGAVGLLRRPLLLDAANEMHSFLLASSLLLLLVYIHKCLLFNFLGCLRLVE